MNKYLYEIRFVLDARPSPCQEVQIMGIITRTFGRNASLSLIYSMYAGILSKLLWEPAPWPTIFSS